MKFSKPLLDSIVASPPEHLYKYISFKKQSYIEDIIVHSRLYFSLPSQFRENDAFDTRAYNFVIKGTQDRRQWLKKEIAVNYPHLTRHQKKEMRHINLHEHKDTDSAFYQQRVNRLNQIFNDVDGQRICIFCVTDSSHRIEMWKQYIPNGEGICIKLNRNVILDALITSNISASVHSSHIFDLRRVEYVTLPREISVSKLMNSDSYLLGTTLLYTKLDSFSFEKEWRFIIPECINQSILFSPDMIEEIVLGPNTTKEQIKLIETWNARRSIPFKTSTTEFRYA